MGQVIPEEPEEEEPSYSAEPEPHDKWADGESATASSPVHAVPEPQASTVKWADEEEDGAEAAAPQARQVGRLQNGWDPATGQQGRRNRTVGKLDVGYFEQTLQRNTLEHAEPTNLPTSSAARDEFGDLFFALEQDGYAQEDSRTDVHVLSDAPGTQESASDFVDVGHGHEETGTDAHHSENELESLSADAARMLAQLAM